MRVAPEPHQCAARRGSRLGWCRRGQLRGHVPAGGRAQRVRGDRARRDRPPRRLPRRSHGDRPRRVRLGLRRCDRACGARRRSRFAGAHRSAPRALRRARRRENHASELAAGARRHLAPLASGQPNAHAHPRSGRSRSPSSGSELQQLRRPDRRGGDVRGHRCVDRRGRHVLRHVRHLRRPGWERPEHEVRQSRPEAMASASTLAEKPPLPTSSRPASCRRTRSLAVPHAAQRRGDGRAEPHRHDRDVGAAEPAAAPVAGLPSVSMYTKTPSPSASGVAIPGSTT